MHYCSRIAPRVGRWAIESDATICLSSAVTRSAFYPWGPSRAPLEVGVLSRKDKSTVSK
jgi:hypothetical protein